MLQPARPIFSRDGSARSELYDDIYHASDGGPGQARHVFLAGNGLPGRWQRRARFTILENGFGTGLNFLATWAAWRADPDRPGRLHYLAVEKHPLSISDLGRVHRAWNEFQPLAEALRHAWPVATPGFHRLAFAGGRVVLTLMLGDAGHCLRHLRARVDAFFLDGFDPRKNPDMWSVELFRRCARLAAPDATLATWCVAGSVREALKEAGFVTEKRPGFARKREMLTGRLATPCAVPEVKQSARHAVIVGAGLAGCTMAERLTDRGWRVELLERYGAPAAEASGNLAGIVRPLLSRDDNLASRLSRACFLHTGRAWSAVDRAGRGPRRRLDGLLQVARDGEHEALQRQLASIYPEDYVRFVERDEAQRLLGGATAFGGWWFPGGGWGHPPGVCRSLLARGGVDGRLDFRFGADVARMEHREGAWRLFDAQGGVLAEAPTVILASGAHALRLGQTVGLPVTRVRGQVSHLPVGFLPALNHPVCREGYLTPALDGLHCLARPTLTMGKPPCGRMSTPAICVASPICCLAWNGGCGRRIWVDGWRSGPPLRTGCPWWAPCRTPRRH